MRQIYCGMELIQKYGRLFSRISHIPFRISFVFHFPFHIPRPGWRRQYPRHCSWTKRVASFEQNVAAMVYRWQHCVRFIGPGLEPLSSRLEIEGLNVDRMMLLQLTVG